MSSMRDIHLLVLGNEMVVIKLLSKNLRIHFKLLLLLGRVTEHWDVGAAAAAKVGDDDDDG